MRATGQLAYAIGNVEQVSFLADIYLTGELPEGAIEHAIREVVPLTPGGIIAALYLRRPIYGPTSAYGYFGRQEPGFTWETTLCVSLLREQFELQTFAREDQRDLSRFVGKLNSKKGLSSEMQMWWLGRY